MLQITSPTGRRLGFRALFCTAKAIALAILMAFVVTACQKAPQPPPSPNAATPAPTPAKRHVARTPATTPARATPRPAPSLPPFAEGSTVFNIVIADIGYLPTPLSIPSGKKITLVITNRGKTPHEFMAGYDLTPDKDGFKTDLFKGIPVQAIGGMPETGHPPSTATGKASTPAAQAAQKATTLSPKPGATTKILVAPNSTAFMTFTLPPDRKGEYETACFEPGHYVQRLHGILRVE